MNPDGVNPEFCNCCDSSCNNLESYTQSTYGISEDGFCYKCNSGSYSDLECNCCEGYTPEPEEPEETDPIYGCTDEDYDNYNPQANTDDGSCMDVPDFDMEWCEYLDSFMSDVINNPEYGGVDWSVEEYCSWCNAEEQGDELPLDMNLQDLCGCCNS